MVEEKKYVVYGMRAKSSEGVMENYISMDVGHGVVYQGNPLLNANDHTPLPCMFANSEHMIDGAPALTMESQCACRFGGVMRKIKIYPEMLQIIRILRMK